MRFHFGEFCFDSDRRELSGDGGRIHLTRKALQLLQLLLEQRPRVLSKEEIQSTLWPSTFVEESNLSVLVTEVRQALGDNARKPRFVRTSHGFGYGFVADVRDERTATVRIHHGERQFALVEGENLVGRDDAARVRLTGPGISRRHARIVVDGDIATIEDLGSKNGTFVCGKRVESSARLRDGDEILVSRAMLVVRIGDASYSTITEMA